MSEQNRDPGLTALEAALTALTPTPAAINRDVLLFRAGQASVKRRWLWPTTSGVLAAVAASLAITLVRQPPTEPIREVHFVQVEVPVKSQAPSNRSTTDSNPRYSANDSLPEHSSRVHEYRSVQNQLLRWGLDAIPSPHRLAAERPIVTDPSLRSTEPPAFGWPWLQNLFAPGERS